MKNKLYNTHSELMEYYAEGFENGLRYAVEIEIISEEELKLFGRQAAYIMNELYGKPAKRKKKSKK